MRPVVIDTIWAPDQAVTTASDMQPAPRYHNPLPLRSWLLLAAIALLIGTILGFLT